MRIFLSTVVFISLIGCSTDIGSELENGSGASAIFENEFYGTTTGLFVTSSAGLDKFINAQYQTRFDVRTHESEDPYYYVSGYADLDARVNWSGVISHPNNELGELIDGCGESVVCAAMRKGSWIMEDGQQSRAAMTFYGFRNVSGDEATEEPDFTDAGAASNIRVDLTDLLSELEMLEDTADNIACPGIDYSDQRATVRLSVKPHLANENQFLRDLGDQIYQVAAALK
ncbi:MAG: hypothetical protein IPJ88_09305 [Myxococcales bacterium]|nr:MAG: hypothetical protein IPJ88_09305 [Myxococcales bacterium]